MKTSKIVLLAIVVLCSFIGVDTADAVMCTADTNGCWSLCIIGFLLNGCQQQTPQAVGAGGCPQVIPISGSCGVENVSGLWSCSINTTGCGGSRSSGACTFP